MATDKRLICASEDLVEGGLGVRFETDAGDGKLPAFAVRYGGRVYAYVNRCSHVGIELDWVAGRFFDDQGRFLMCATHGAIYEPDSGRCAGGPCRGGQLEAVPVVESDGQIFITGKANQ